LRRIRAVLLQRCRGDEGVSAAATTEAAIAQTTVPVSSCALRSFLSFRFSLWDL